MGIHHPFFRFYYTLTLLIFAFIISGNISYAQQLDQKEIRFQSFGIKDGLAQNSVNVVYQDNFGYIWIGTQAGIDRYDGYVFQNFEHATINTDGPNIVWCHAIAGGTDNMLWFGDQLGNLSKFNPFTNSWYNYDVQKDQQLEGVNLPEQPHRITQILPLSDTNVVVYGTNAVGLYVLNVENGEKVRVPLSEKLSVQPAINDLIEIDQNTLLIASDNGLWQFDVSKNEMTLIKFDATYTTLAIHDIFPKGEETFLLATENGLLTLDYKNKDYQTIISRSKLIDKVGTSVLTAIHKHSTTENLWVSIQNVGLAVFDLENEQMRSFTVSNSANLGIVSDIFYKIIEDQQGILWFASYTQGLVKYDPLAQRIQRYSNAPSSPIKLGFDIVWGVHIDSKKNIWIGDIEPGGGIHILNSAKSTNQKYLYGNSSLGSRFWAFAEDIKGNMYVYHNEGNEVKLYRKEVNGDNISYLGLNTELGEKLPFSARAATYLNQNGQLLICGTEDVIMMSNKDGELKFTSFEALNAQLSERVLDFYAEGDKTYVMTQTQLYVWNEQTNKLTALIPNTETIDFIEAGASNDIQFVVFNEKDLYLPTYGKGLYHLDLTTTEHKYYTGADGLQNRYLYNCYVDNEQNLWMSSNLGIIHYLREEHRFISYGPYEGAQNYEFNANSSYQAQNGIIAMGGITGLNVFNPKDVTAQSDPPTVLIQKMSLNDREIAYEQDGRLAVSDFIFPYENNSVGFDYVAFNYRNTDQNLYAYQLVGYDDERIEAGNRQFVNYTNLREGNYTFKVYASNHQGMWNDVGAMVSFKILAPWYRTMWAYSLYIIFFGAFLFVYNRIRVKQERKKAEDSRKQEELAAARDFQLRMLPEKMPQKKGFDVAAKQITSAEVGGDYYDYFESETDAEHLRIVCGDATGHGTASGMMVSVTKSALQALEGGSPELVMAELNKVVKNMNLGTLRMSLTILNFENEKVKLASAAMPPVYVYRKASNTVEEYLTGDMPLGALRRQKYDLLEFALASDDIIVLISDGLPEMPNPNGELLEYERVKACIVDNSSKNAQEILQALFKLGLDWQAKAVPPEDDVTAVVIKFN